MTTFGSKKFLKFYKSREENNLHLSIFKICISPNTDKIQHIAIYVLSPAQSQFLSSGHIFLRYLIFLLMACLHILDIILSQPCFSNIFSETLVCLYYQLKSPVSKQSKLLSSAFLIYSYCVLLQKSFYL